MALYPTWHLFQTELLLYNRETKMVVNRRGPFHEWIFVDFVNMETLQEIKPEGVAQLAGDHASRSLDCWLNSHLPLGPKLRERIWVIRERGSRCPFNVCQLWLSKLRFAMLCSYVVSFEWNNSDALCCWYCISSHVELSTFLGFLSNKCEVMFLTSLILMTSLVFLHICSWKKVNFSFFW